MQSPTVALLGLGAMGAGMGKQLLAKGFALRVYNRTTEKTKPLQEAGAYAAASPADAVRGASIVLSILSDDEASRAVWMSGPEPALPALAPKTVLIESGTVTPEWTAELAAQATAVGCSLVDAPVTGSKPQAERGELIFLTGGSESDFAAVQPVLEAMAKRVVYLGPSGSGSRMKLINNFLAGVQLASLAEAMGWIEHSGIDRDKALDVLRNGAPGSPFLQLMSQRMVARDYELNFRVRLMAKDLRYARLDAASEGVDLRVGTAALNVFENSVAKGHGDQDISSVVEQFRDGASASGTGKKG